MSVADKTGEVEIKHRRKRRAMYGISDTIMTMPNAQDTLDQYFLEMRWRCLSLAADLDRVQRAEGSAAVLQSDVRLEKLRKAIGTLLEEGVDRAERVQEIFSDKTPPPKKG